MTLKHGITLKCTECGVVCLARYHSVSYYFNDMTKIKEHISKYGFKHFAHNERWNCPEQQELMCETCFERELMKYYLTH